MSIAEKFLNPKLMAMAFMAFFDAKWARPRPPSPFHGHLTSGPGFLTPYEIRRVQAIIEKKKWNIGAQPLVMAFECPEAARDSGAVGKGFDLDIAEKRQYLGRIIHVFSRGLAVVFVDPDVRAWLAEYLKTLQPETIPVGNSTTNPDPGVPGVISKSMEKRIKIQKGEA